MYTMHPHHVVQIYLGSIHTYIHMYLCVTDIKLKSFPTVGLFSIQSFQLPSFVVYSAIDARTYKPASCLNSSVDNMPTTSKHLLMYSFITNFKPEKLGLM